MRTRRKYYKDYGLTNEDVLDIKKRVLTMDEEDRNVLWNAAVYTNPCIAKELFASLEKNMTYRELADKDYIPYNYEDFYGYQRKCLVMFRNLLILCGRYKGA